MKQLIKATYHLWLLLWFEVRDGNTTIQVNWDGPRFIGSAPTVHDSDNVGLSVRVCHSSEWVRQRSSNATTHAKICPNHLGLYAMSTSFYLIKVCLHHMAPPSLLDRLIRSKSYWRGRSFFCDNLCCAFQMEIENMVANNALLKAREGKTCVFLLVLVSLRRFGRLKRWCLD